MADRSAVDSCCPSPKMLNNPHIMQRQRIIRRFTAADPCPICGGHDALGRGQGLRCFGYYDRSGKYARCTREERAGSLPQNSDGTYSHRLHGAAAAARGTARPPAMLRRTMPAPPHRPRSAPGAAAFPLVLHARRLPQAPLRRGHGRPALDLPRRRRPARPSASCASITAPPTAPRAKSYRPCHKAADGRWLLSRPAAPLPLYHLPAILAAPPQATVTRPRRREMRRPRRGDRPALRHHQRRTAPRRPQLTDWCPLAGRRVAILGDEDEDGAGYAAQVACPPGRPRSPRRGPDRRACPASPRARTSSSSSTPAAPPAAPTPTSSPSCSG